MISVPLAKQLRAAGLDWQPRRHDFFHIPDRDLDDRVFVIADFSVDVQRLSDGIAAIAFNGAVEWSLDYILQQDVVWLPTESQVRDRLGCSVVSLERSGEGWVCTVDMDGGLRRFEAASAVDAYGIAALAMLRSGRRLTDSDPNGSAR